MRSAIVGAVLLVAGCIAIATGAYPAADALALANRVWPVLLFVMAITVVAELASAAGLFEVVASWTTRVARGNTWMLWLLTVAVAIVSTVFLSLDTTAVLLTPIVVVMARRVGANPLPFALTTVMLANTASMLLPVSNLTNLLAEQKLGGLDTAGFVALSWAPAVVAVLLSSAAIAIVGRRSLSKRYEIDGKHPDSDRPLVIVSAVVVVALMAALVSGVPVWIPACAAAIALVVLFLFVHRETVRISLLPWQTIVLVCGLFLVTDALNVMGAGAGLRALAGHGADVLDLLRISGLGLVSANAINNLPAYLALEPAASHPLQLMALLIGVNVGALITPWASLATLLWHSRLARLDVAVPWRRYMVIGAVVAPITVAAATLSLLLVA